MTNVLVLSTGPDTGGQGIRIKQAFDRYGGEDWTVRAVCATTNYLRYPQDARWDEVEALYTWADLVHHKTGLYGYRAFDRGRRKPAVVHWQGTDFRADPASARKEADAIGATQLVSTVDLLLDAPDAEWLPTPYNLDALGRYRNPKGGRETLIAHAPTARAIKGTDDVIAAVSALAGLGVRAALDIIEGVEWKVCLSRKGRAAIFVDQLKLGYGNNSVEAWAMGVPVVAHAENPRVTALMRELWGDVPYVDASAADLAEYLAELAVNPDLRQEWAARGMSHARTYHDEPAVVRRLSRIWRETLD